MILVSQFSIQLQVPQYVPVQIIDDDGRESSINLHSNSSVV